MPRGLPSSSFLSKSSFSSSSSSLHWSVSSSNVAAYASFGEEGTEATALLKWKASLDNQSQSLQSSWVGTNNPCNNWVGIGCNNVGRVTSMNFTSYGLRGTLHNFNFSSFPSLLRMDFRNNSLPRIIPPHFSNLSKLIFLDLSLNHLSGTIPFEMCLLSNLNFFDMSLNQISGSIPQQIGMLSSLNGLSLHSNYLTGSIFASIGNLSGLSTCLFCNSNKLSGHIPSNIGNLRKLQMLSLFQNQLTGTILPELNNLTFFVVFALSQNELIGQLPRDICFGGLLRPLAPNDNHIQDFGTYPSLNYIDLSYNKFYGQLSEKWGESRDLTSFRISNINISGGIPPKLAKATHLCVLDNSSNQLVGEIPIKLWCGSTKTCSIEKLGNFHNELHGSIQSTLDGMLSLALVDISYNQLEGPLPNIKAFQVPFEALRGNTVVKLGGFVVYEAHLLSGQVVTVKKFEVSQAVMRKKPWILNGLRVNVIKGVANGLSYKHHECLPPIIHQDISSKNVLLDGEYVAHISDFGTARFLKPDSYYWTSFAGTIGYAAAGTKVLHCFNNENLFAIWSYDGKMVYENIIPVTQRTSVEHCIGVGGYGIIYMELAFTMEVNERLDVYSHGALALEVLMGTHLGNLISSFLITTYYLWYIVERYIGYIVERYFGFTPLTS
ncbi:unnamed protein product [Camellia sinensis]